MQIKNKKTLSRIFATLSCTVVLSFFGNIETFAKDEETKQDMVVYTVDLHDSTPLDTLKKDVIETYLESNPKEDASTISFDLSTLCTSDINWNLSGLQTIQTKLQLVRLDENGKAKYPIGYDYSSSATLNLKREGAPQVILKSNDVNVDLGSTFNYSDNLVINADFKELPVLNMTSNVDVNTEGTYQTTVKVIFANSTSTLNYTVHVVKTQEMLEQEAAAKVAEEEAARRTALQAEQQEATQAEAQSVSYASLPAMGSGNDVVSFAMSLVGSAYSFGGTSPLTGFDCSGFTQYVYGQFGIDLPHSSSGQSQYGSLVDPSEAQPGDLVTYYGHSAIYIGDGLVVNALNPGAGVNVLSMYAINNGGMQVHRLG